MTQKMQEITTLIADPLGLAHAESLVNKFEAFIRTLRALNGSSYGFSILEEAQQTVSMQLRAKMKPTRSKVPQKPVDADFDTKRDELIGDFIALGNKAQLQEHVLFIKTNQHAVFEEKFAAFQDKLGKFKARFADRASQVLEELTTLQDNALLVLKERKREEAESTKESFDPDSVQFNASELQLRQLIVVPELKNNTAKRSKKADKATVNYGFLFGVLENVWQDDDVNAFIADPNTFYAGSVVFAFGVTALCVFTFGPWGTLGLGLSVLVVAGVIAATGAILAAPGVVRGTQKTFDQLHRFFYTSKEGDDDALPDPTDSARLRADSNAGAGKT